MEIIIYVSKIMEQSRNNDDPWYNNTLYEKKYIYIYNKLWIKFNELKWKNIWFFEKIRFKNIKKYWIRTLTFFRMTFREYDSWISIVYIYRDQRAKFLWNLELQFQFVHLRSIRLYFESLTILIELKLLINRKK